MKVYQFKYNILLQISGSLLLYKKPDTWGQVPCCSEQQLKQLKHLCHLLGTTSVLLLAQGADPALLVPQQAIFDNEVVPLLLTIIDAK